MNHKIVATPDGRFCLEAKNGTIQAKEMTMETAKKIVRALKIAAEHDEKYKAVMK